MNIGRKIERTLRGEVAAGTVAREILRRGRVAIQRRRERAALTQRNSRAAQLQRDFARLSPRDLLKHFQQRSSPQFFAGFSGPLLTSRNLQEAAFPLETAQLISHAENITNNHSWSLLGLPEKSFGSPTNWHRDPLSGIIWPLQYHADMQLVRGDGSDVRVLWELNRLSHLITLARAYAVTGNERFGENFFSQVESWRSQNPFGLGANWNCAMEVALRAMNLLGAFETFRQSPQLNEQRLMELLTIFDQHGDYVLRNLEFSYIATSNHYLSDVVGLLWLGLMLPELEASVKWRDFGLREMLKEMDKQVLPDGADYEASTGYHRFVLELFFYSFILCRTNGVEIEERYWHKLKGMLDYTRAYLRPDGKAPIIGDSDSGQVFPVCHRSADDHSYLLAIGAAFYNEPRFKPAGLAAPEELLWILGEPGLREFQNLKHDGETSSQAFTNAGTYVLRDRDLYLLFNASGAGINGRGSHGHNDGLSVEVSACGRPFIVDPGTYVYTANLHERHLFRSTAYHSTIEVDGKDQNSTNEQVPFVIGNEAQPRMLLWKAGTKSDQVSAEHEGYLRRAATHRRTVTFNKRERWWLIEDELLGRGEHTIRVRFHFDSGLEVESNPEGIVSACDNARERRLLVCSLDLRRMPEFEHQPVSRDYGAQTGSISACWTARTSLPYTLRWALVPACRGDDLKEKFDLVAKFLEGAGNFGEEIV